MAVRCITFQRTCTRKLIENQEEYVSYLYGFYQASLAITDEAIDPDIKKSASILHEQLAQHLLSFSKDENEA